MQFSKNKEGIKACKEYMKKFNEAYDSNKWVADEEVMKTMSNTEKEEYLLKIKVHNTLLNVMSE